MSNEQRPEQPAIPAEVINAELNARLEFTENRLLAMHTIAYNLELKCGQLTQALAERSEEIAALREAAEKAEAVGGDVKPPRAKKVEEKDA
ncbi:hypothetical protein ACK83U_00965 [Rhizobium sp. WW22]|uniref:hypothetical protein n=1 Tax=Rhizobium sp. WW22 TaxID=3389070 RepID=UPI00399C455C